eukprot:7390481-Ditylum_brightwellii.AAC.1
MDDYIASSADFTSSSDKSGDVMHSTKKKGKKKGTETKKPGRNPSSVLSTSKDKKQKSTMRKRNTLSDSAFEGKEIKKMEKKGSIGRSIKNKK